MGCWEETCGITNTPIFENDEVVMVVMNDKIGDREIDLGSMGSFFDLENITHIVKGQYDHYGWVRDYRKAKRGDVIEETDKGTVYETNEWMRKAMFHRAAWDAILEQDPPDESLVSRCGITKHREDDGPMVDPALLAEFCCVNGYCRLARRNILGSRNACLQESPGEFKKQHMFLLDLSKKMLNKRRRRAR